VTELAKCWGCHKPVRFVPTEKGNLMPLDPDPAGQSIGTARLGNASLGDPRRSRPRAAA
jgi:hypothetical protein